MGSGEGLFTTAYFHLPRDLRAEVAEAGFSTVQILSVEGRASSHLLAVAQSPVCGPGDRRRPDRAVPTVFR